MSMSNYIYSGLPKIATTTNKKNTQHEISASRCCKVHWILTTKISRSHGKFHRQLLFLTGSFFALQIDRGNVTNSSHSIRLMVCVSLTVRHDASAINFYLI